MFWDFHGCEANWNNCIVILSNSICIIQLYMFLWRTDWKELTGLIHSSGLHLPELKCFRIFGKIDFQNESVQYLSLKQKLMLNDDGYKRNTGDTQRHVDFTVADWRKWWAAANKTLERWSTQTDKVQLWFRESYTSIFLWAFSEKKELTVKKSPPFWGFSICFYSFLRAKDLSP